MLTLFRHHYNLLTVLQCSQKSRNKINSFFGILDSYIFKNKRPSKPFYARQIQIIMNDPFFRQIGILSQILVEKIIGILIYYFEKLLD